MNQQYNGEFRPIFFCFLFIIAEFLEISAKMVSVTESYLFAFVKWLFLQISGPKFCKYVKLKKKQLKRDTELKITLEVTEP